MNDDTVAASEVMPLMIRMSAIDVINQMLSHSYEDEGSSAEFREQVRGVLALVDKVERRCKSE